MGNKVRNKFYVMARITLDVGCDITAKDLDDAIARSKQMKLTDFVTIDGECNDSKFRVSGVFEQGEL